MITSPACGGLRAHGHTLCGFTPRHTPVEPAHVEILWAFILSPRIRPMVHTAAAACQRQPATGPGRCSRVTGCRPTSPLLSPGKAVRQLFRNEPVVDIKSWVHGQRRDEARLSDEPVKRQG